MKKLSLSVDDLHIQSFTTDDTRVDIGTVHGQALTNYGAQTCNGYPVNTCVGYGTCWSCYFTQCGTCDGCTQVESCGTCVETCGYGSNCGPDQPDTGGGGTGPIWSSGWTQCDNCNQSVNEAGTCIAPCG